MKSLPIFVILCLLLTAFSCTQQKAVQPQTVDHLAKYRDTIILPDFQTDTIMAV